MMKINLLLIVLMMFSMLFLASCEETTTDTGEVPPPPPPPEPPLGEVFVVNITDITETDWDYMIGGKDGSSIFIDTDASTYIPTHMYLKPSNNSDAGITMNFKENGLPNMMVANDYIYYFGNYNGNNLDYAKIAPNGTIEYTFGQVTSINWSAYPIRTQSEKNMLKMAKNGTLLGKLLLPNMLSNANITTFTENEEIDNGFSDAALIVNFQADFGCGTYEFAECFENLVYTVENFYYLDMYTIYYKTEQINEAIRRIDGDGMTIIPADLLEQLMQLQVPINYGNNPPNIEGQYIMSPLVLVRSNFNDMYDPGYQFADMNATFSSQNNDRMTVFVDYTQASQAGSGTAYITGSGNKFTIFNEMVGNYGGYPLITVDIWSGEISPNGIIDFHMALIVTLQAPGTINEGEGRLIYDSDGISEKIGNAGTRVVIDMYDKPGDGWDHSAALRVDVNGTTYTYASVFVGEYVNTYSMYVSPGDVVNIYYTGKEGSFHYENAFVVYYGSTPPSPAFDPYGWNGNNALLYRLQGSLSDDDLDQLLGSFTVSRGGNQTLYPSVHASHR